MSQQSFRPASDGFDGGFFGPPVNPPAAGESGPSHDVPEAAAAFGGGSTAAPADLRGAVAGLPPLVAVVIGFLLLTAVGALYGGVSAFVLVQATRTTVGGGAPGDGVVVRALVLLANSGANVYLCYLLLRGKELGRNLTTGICSWWVLYWLYEASKASVAFGRLTASPVGVSFGFGQIGAVATLGVLLLACWAAVTAGLLWAPSSSRHFG